MKREIKKAPQLFVLGILCLGMTFLSCEKEAAPEEPLTEEETVETIVDPFYAVLNEQSTLEDYWELFVADAIRSGKPDPGTGKNINIFLEVNQILPLGLQQITQEEPMIFAMMKR